MNQENSLILSFGAQPSAVDYRTVQQSDMANGAAVIPQTAFVDLEKPTTNDLCYQGKLGICTDCAVRVTTEETLSENTRLDEYWGYLIGKVMIDKNLDEGSSALTMLKSAKTYGIPPLSVRTAYPLVTGGTYAQFIANFKYVYGGKIPQPILDAAAKHKIPGYYSVPLTPLSIASEIAAGRTVVIRIVVGENFYTSVDGRSSWNAKDILPLRAPEYPVSGHLMVISKYTGLNSLQLLEGPNSWGRTWGNNGYFSFIFNVQYPYYFSEAWSVDDLPQSVSNLISDLPEAKHFSHTFSATMRRGDTGPEVRALQILLSILGLLNIHVDELGIFGPKTAASVMAFQRKYGVASEQEIVSANGNAGPKTVAALNAAGSSINK